MNENEWFIIYRDNFASRFIMLATFSVPLLGAYTSERLLPDLRDGRFADAIRNTDIVKQMGVFAALPVLFYCVVACLAWRLNHLRLHRIYANKNDQKIFVAVISRFGFIASKVAFTRQNVRILESADHPFWSYIKGSIRINKRRFVLHDQYFRDPRYRLFLLGRITKLPEASSRSNLPHRTMM
ncbi:unnamed protein product [Gongylonema pulchrum]|uniref:Anoctamin n=1 Tax=Gongylonema pulchrum TaxID=637853 RepID=A0A183EIQ0_9BILA|nr:unnamed protein product [Gongylonema pulchrum]